MAAGWRHETTAVEQRALEQWVLEDHRLPEELLRDTTRNWRAGGRSAVLSMTAQLDRAFRGFEIDFALEDGSEKIRVFTTRVDTIYGATCLILAPEHPCAKAARRRGAVLRPGR